TVGIAFVGGDFHYPAEVGGLVAGNVIGLNSQGDTLGNRTTGIGAAEGSNGITIGGPAAALANTIAGNQGPGIWLGYFPYFDVHGLFYLYADQIRIQGNRIHDNAGLAIDLGGLYGNTGPNGVTPNDSPHVGPNFFQNFPVLSSATSS